MTEYRIYTEDRPNLPALVSYQFDAFTILRGLGYWKGTQERSAVIIILAKEQVSQRHDSTRGNVNALCEAIRRENEQEAVLYTVQTVEQVTMTAEGGLVS